MKDQRLRQRIPDSEVPSTSTLGMVSIMAFLTRAGAVMSLSGIVILIGGLAVWLTIIELRGASQVLIAISVLMLLTAGLTNRSAVKNAIFARAGRYAANTLIMVVALSTILVLLSFISYENAYRLDLTSTRQFTLAPQTKKVLSDLGEPIKATLYSTPGDVRQESIKRQADDFFFAFNRQNRQFSYEFVDPDLKPSRARQDGVTEYPTIVFSTPDSERRSYLLTPIYFGQDISLVTEQDLVSSILISTGQKQKVVYFTTGHGERDTADADEATDGFGFARRGLVGDNYLVRTINLKQVENIPDDAAVLVVAGPRSSFLSDERDKIEQYLTNGGRSIFLVEDAINTQLNFLFEKWGMYLPRGVILDELSSVSADPTSPIVPRSSYSFASPITKPLDDTFFTEATSIISTIVKAPEGLPPNPDETNIIQSPLAITSPRSCIIAPGQMTDCSEENELTGPLVIAMAVEAMAIVGEDYVRGEAAKAKPTSMIIIGDSDFVTNRFYYALNNSDLFLNSVDWLAEKYDLISIRAKPQAFRLLVFDQKQFDFVRYSSWFLLPTGILFLSGIAWWRRR